MKSITLLLKIIICLSALSTLYCSLRVTDTGTSAETTNGKLIATVVLEDGTPVAGADVFIRPDTFLRDTLLLDEAPKSDAITDSSGKFRIDSIDSGDYLLEIRAGNKLACLTKCSFNEINGFSHDFDQIIMDHASAFYGNVYRVNPINDEQIYIQVYGQERIAAVDSAGSFRFTGIAPGIHKLRVFSSKKASGINSEDTISVGSKEIADIGTLLLPDDYWHDSVIVRTILDINNLSSVNISEVVEYQHGRIKTLDLSNHQLQIIPDEIRQLRLHTLLLASTGLDSITKEIGRLRRLKVCDISNNTISRIPGSFGNLKRLKKLNLSNNKLDNLPPTMVSLTNIEQLTVSGNMLIDIDPDVKIWLDVYATDVPYWQDLQKEEN